MNALLFPGQGSQVVEWAWNFYNNFSIVKKIFEEADEKLNFKISKNYFRGSRNDLKLIKNTQPLNINS